MEIASPQMEIASPGVRGERFFRGPGGEGVNPQATWIDVKKNQNNIDEDFLAFLKINTYLSSTPGFDSKNQNIG